MKTTEYPRLGETLLTETLPNGLQILILPKRGFSKRYAFFATNYGGCDRRFRLGGKWVETPAGVAHFLEHKMFDTEDGDAMSKLSAYGASPNAFTSAKLTAYYFECTEHFESCLKILLDFVSVPYFTQQSVDKEQGIIGQEIRMGEDNPDRVVLQNFLRAQYTAHPIRDSIAGTVESIANIDAQMLYDCHKVFYNPSNMVLCVAGDVDAERVVRIARTHVQAPAGERPARDYGRDDGLQPIEREKCAVMSVAMPLFVFGAKLPFAAGNDQHRLTMTADLACEYLLGTSSPLYARLYTEGLIHRNLAAGSYDFPGGAVCIVEGESREPQRVMDAVCAQVQALQAGGLDSRRFLRLKRAALGANIKSMDSMENCCYGLASGYFDGYDALREFELLESIQEEEVAAFLAETFSPERLALSVVEPGGTERTGEKDEQ